MSDPRPLTPMRLAVEGVRQGLSYAEAAREHSVSESGVRRACKRDGVSSSRTVLGGAAKKTKIQKESRGERVVQATRRWLSGETQASIAASMGVHLRTVQDLVADGMRERAEQREIDLRSMRVHLLEQHIGLAAAFGAEARAALADGERGDAARCATVMQRSLDSLAKMVGADAPAQMQVEHTGPDMMAILRDAVAKAPGVMALPNGATLGKDD